MYFRPTALSLIIAISLFPAIGFAAAEAPDPVRFADLADEFVEGELVVMFAPDTGRHAARALRQSFAQLLDARAGSLDALIARHRVHKIRRVFRTLEDEQGQLRHTARERAATDRLAHRHRQSRVGPLDDIPALEDVFVLELGKGVDVRQAAAEFERHERVLYAHPNDLYHFSAEPLPPVAYIPDDPFLTADGIHWSEGEFGQSYPDLYGLRNIQALEAWNEFDLDDSGDFSAEELRPGEGVIVAVLDSGVQLGLPDIAANIWTNIGEIGGNAIDDDGNGFADDVNGWDFGNGDNSPVPDQIEVNPTFGHGTHVAGTIAAVADNTQGVAGVAPWATIMSVKISSGLTITAIAAADAVFYAVDNGADILSNSWGGPSNATIENAFAYAYTQGVLSIASAGNSNASESETIPADIPTVVSVAATDDQDQRASFTNYGHRIDIAAPGVSVLSVKIGGGYWTLSGTSMACPHVAGAAAVLFSRYPSDSLDEIRGRLRAGADDLGPSNPDYMGVLGSGRLNVLNSLTTPVRPMLAITSVSEDGFDRGAEAEITINVENFWEAASNVQGTLSTSSSYITILDGTADFGDIAIAESSANTSDPFVVSIDPQTPYSTAFDFELDLIGTDHQQTETFQIYLTAFRDVSDTAQLPGVAVLPWHVGLQDYDGDPHPDATLVDGFSFVQLYRSQGDGSFQPDFYYPGSLELFRSLLIDLDADGDQDMLLSGVNSTHLFRNDGGGVMTDITVGSGIPAQRLLVFAAIDIDRDGRVDIVTGGNDQTGKLSSTFVLRNNGDETFTDIRAASGLTAGAFGYNSAYGKLEIIDYDLDNDLDLITVGRHGHTTLTVWQNDGAGIFSDVTAQAFPGGLPDSSTEAWIYSITTGDYDNDGDSDLFVTQQNVDASSPEYVTGFPVLYQNNADGTFSNVTASTGDLSITNIMATPLGSEFFDYDNDGDLDLYVTRDGVAYSGTRINTWVHTLFTNDGNGSFSIMDDGMFGREVNPRISTAAIGDYDSDGGLDVYAPATLFVGGTIGGLFRNLAGSANNWLHVDLEGRTSNRDGYGARVTIEVGAAAQMREIHTSALDPTTAHFGLGQATSIDSIEVRWPSGIVQHLEDVAVNQRLFVAECDDGDGDGVCDEADNCIDDANADQDDSDGDSCGNVCDADFDQSGLAAVADFGLLAQNFGTNNLAFDITELVEGPVGVSDFGRFLQLFGSIPGPSGTTPGTAACPAQ